jgi:N-acylneuraminate cytidylyltransferase
MTNQTPNILAIIPARAGSKRLLGKNTKILAGKPLVQWTIEAAMACPLINKVLVSTDDPQVLGIAKGLSCAAPFNRPSHLAMDESSSIDVVKHAIEYMSSAGQNFDFVMLLQPTSPLRKHFHITEAIQRRNELDANGIISVCQCEHTPLWSNTLPHGFSMEGFVSPKILNKRSQDLPQYYRLNGAIYLLAIKSLYQENSFLTASKTYAYEMSADTSVDVDSELDFRLAEILLSMSQD